MGNYQGWRVLEGPLGLQLPSQREKVWEFLEKWNIPVGCGILGGNGAGDPRASCPSAPGTAPGHWDPLETPAGLSLCFPILLSGITRLDPGTPEQLGTVWALGFSLGISPRTCTGGAVPGPVLGMLLLGWLGVTCCSLGCFCAHPRIPGSLTHGNIPSRAWSRGGENTQQCQWGV